MENCLTNLELREECPLDLPAIYKVNSEAFERVEEANLVDRLRCCRDKIPQLSLVALIDNKPIAHVLFTEIEIKDGITSHKSLALAPIAVLPKWQGNKIGTRLIRYGLGKAKELGYKSVFVLGHETYYPRFGFESARKWNIKAPFDVPDPIFMATELLPDGLKNVSGTVAYPKEFERV